MAAAAWRDLGTAGLVALLAGAVSGCGGSSWEGIRHEDTVAAYHRFIRDHPGAPQVAQARQRIDYLRLGPSPAIEAFERFAAEHPASPRLGELRQRVEPRYFERARSENSPAAYRDFLSRFPGGRLAPRARGDLVYTESVRDDPSAAVLRDFVERYPESDFTGEARETLELLALRDRTRIRTLGVRVDVGPGVTQAERVRQGFVSVIARHYREHGIQVVPLSPGEEIPAQVQGWAQVDYHEAPASGTFGGRTLLSQCRVRIYSREGDEPVWDRSFEAPAEHVIHGAYGRDRTVFANATYRFWQEFFVPISTWATSGIRVHRESRDREIGAIDVRGERAVILYLRGGVDHLDVSSPLEPVLLQRYRRERDLSRWTRVEMLRDDLVAAYGPDGLELVQLGGVQARRVGRWELPEVGSIGDVALYEHPEGDTLLFAGTRGVFAVRLGSPLLRAHPLLEGEFVGLHLARPYIYLVRPAQVEVSTPSRLLEHRTGLQLPLGKGFGARRVRVAGSSLFVFGKQEVVEVSLATPGRPRRVAALPRERVGKLRDLVADGAHLYLLGDRGLGIAGPSGQEVSDLVQVDADGSLARKGRYLFLTGGRTLEVLDVSPYQAAAASPAP